MIAAFEYFKSDEAWGAQRNWQRAELGIGVAVPFYNDVLWLGAAGGSNLGSALPADRLFALGGPVSLPGYELFELRAAGYWTVSGSYLWRIKDIFSLRGQALYAGVRLQDSEAYDTFDSRNYGQIESVVAVHYRPHARRAGDSGIRGDDRKLAQRVDQFRPAARGRYDFEPRHLPLREIQASQRRAMPR